MATTISSAHIHATPPPEPTLKQTSDLNTYSAITNIREKFHLLAILMFGVGVFALLGGDDVAWADYDGTEHPRNHTHTVSFAWHTYPLVETDTDYGIRHFSTDMLVSVTPPFHFSNGFIDIHITGGEATYGEDYTLFLPGRTDNVKTMKLPVGKDVIPIAISVRNDYVREVSESFTLELNQASYGPSYNISPHPQAEITIYDYLPVSGSGEYTETGRANANPDRGIHIQPTDITIPVGNNHTYTVSLTSQPAQNVTVVAFLDVDGVERNLGKQSNGLWVMPASLTFTPDDWYTPQSFTIVADVVGRYVIIHGLTSLDSDYDSHRYFNGPGIIGYTHVKLDVVGGTSAPPEELLSHFPTRITLSLNPVSVHEGNGTTTITATLDAPAPPDGVDISLYASDGNATDGVDYTLPNTITIPPGEQSGSASIAITDDSLDESNESVTISTYVEVFGQSMTDRTTLTIIDDDTSGVTITTDTAPLSVDEGDTTTYTVHLDSLPTSNVTIHATSSDDGAVSISPESHTFTPSNWDISKTFTVAGVADPDTNYELVHIRHTISSNDTKYTAILLPFVEVRVSDTTQEQGQKEEQEVQEEQEQIPPPETETETETKTEPEQSQLDPIVAQYDTNNSGAIEQDEWVKAKEDYANGKLTNAEIHAISKARA